MLQFITVSDITKHFVFNFTFQHVKESAGCQCPSFFLAWLSENQTMSGEKNWTTDAEFNIVSYWNK